MARQSVTIRERPVSFPHIDRIALRRTTPEQETVNQLDAVAESIDLPLGFVRRLHEHLVFTPEWTRDPNATQIEVKAILAKHRKSSEANKNPDQEHAQHRWLLDGPFVPTDQERTEASGDLGWAAPRKIGTLEAKEAPLAPNTISVREESELRSVKLHARGDHTQLIGEEIPRGFLQVSDHLVPAPPIESNSGRLDLASWMLHPEHPLTARVMVNRVWQGHFGVGLVNTPSDFSTRGGTRTLNCWIGWPGGSSKTGGA